jgi:hypothetical protein
MSETKTLVHRALFEQVVEELGTLRAQVAQLREALADTMRELCLIKIGHPSTEEVQLAVGKRAEAALKATE